MSKEKDYEIVWWKHKEDPIEYIEKALKNLGLFVYRLPSIEGMASEYGRIISKRKLSKKEVKKIDDDDCVEFVDEEGKPVIISTGQELLAYGEKLKRKKNSISKQQEKN